MKKLTTLMAAGLGLLTYNSANAQVGLHVNLNLGGVAVHAAYHSAQVQYPVYDNGDDYYYLPDVEAYYSVPQHCYYYNDGRQWVTSAYLPGQYRNYDWRAARHYEIRGDRPFMHHDIYRTRYGGFDKMGGGYGDNRFDNQSGYDQRGRGFDNHAYGRDGHNGFDQRGYDNRNGQFQGGFDREDRRNRGQYQNGNDNQNHGGYGQSQGGQYGNRNNDQNHSGQYPGSNRSNDGQPQMGNGQNQNGNRNGQPQNGFGNPNGGQSRSGQPSNDGQNRHNGDYQNSNNSNDHFAANRMGVIRPPRF